MKKIFKSVGYIGHFFLWVNLIILFVAAIFLGRQHFFPADALLNWAFIGGIVGAIVVPFTLFSPFISEEKSWISWIKYPVLLLLSLVFGAFLGYTGTIKAGQLWVHFMGSNDEQTVQSILLIQEKKENEINSFIQNYYVCDKELTVTDNKERTFYEDFFIPDAICVTPVIFSSANKDEPLYMQGHETKGIGLIVNSLRTEEQIQEILQQSQTSSAELETKNYTAGEDEDANTTE